MMNGAEIKKERLRLNLTQQELGELLEVSGNTIARWERGEVAPPGMLRWAFIGLARRLGAEDKTGTPEEEARQRRRVKHRAESRNEFRELARKLGFADGRAEAG